MVSIKDLMRRIKDLMRRSTMFNSFQPLIDTIKSLIDTINEESKFKEIVKAEDAVRLLYPENEVQGKSLVLVDRLYRNQTRELLKIICPQAKIGVPWESNAYDALQEWLRENPEPTMDSDYKKLSEWMVVKNFEKLLKPFKERYNRDQITQDLHENAKKVLLDDNSGLTLSLIFSHENLRKDGTTWAWRLLEFDGFKVEITTAAGDKQTVITEIKSGNDVSTAKKQLILRAKFLDVVAAECIKQPPNNPNGASEPKSLDVCLVAAIFRSSPNQLNTVEDVDTTDFIKIWRLRLQTKYFR